MIKDSQGLKDAQMLADLQSYASEIEEIDSELAKDIMAIAERFDTLIEKAAIRRHWNGAE